LLAVLDWHLQRAPDRAQIVHLGDTQEQRITYRELAESARRVARGLQRRGLEKGQSVAIMLPTGCEYFHVYFGILLAGGVPVPIYPPARAAQLEEHVRRHARILANAEAVILVTIARAKLVARVLQAHVPTLRDVVEADQLSHGEGAPYAVPVEPGDVAFIQYTSGSTGDPKGVVLTHANLLANIRAMGKALRVDRDDVFVSWLPLYHDMGLIGGWLSTMYYGMTLVVMSPLAFLARPSRWLHAISTYRGTLSAAPNFAYELCASRVHDDELEGLDLGSWRLALNGAEPVLPETIDRFVARYSGRGLRPEAMMPVYGLAECSVGLAFPPPGRGPRIDVVDRDLFSRQRRAQPARHDDAHPLRFVCCGSAIPGHALRVVDERGVDQPERVEGRVLFRGPSATAGYRGNPQASAQLIRDGWLDTGDHGYLAEGELYLTGRAKDIVIRAGRNVYPHEVEEAVGELAGVRKGCVAVFGSTDPKSGTERLVVLAETRETDAGARERIRAAISTTALDTLGEPLDLVVLAAPHTVLKTSSGKVRRAACRELFETGRLATSAAGARLQILRVAAHAAWPMARRFLRGVGETAFAARGWLVFACVAPLAWCVVALAPQPRIAWASARLFARFALAASGLRLRVSAERRLSPDRACVVVSNHASYLDGIVMVAAIPSPCRFVAKRELLSNPVSRVFLSRLGAVFVERFEAHQSVRDAASLERCVRAGQSLIVFPEGTFRRAPGILAFRLGAFVVAANSAAPVVPVALRGTRTALPDGRWLPSRATIEVVVGPAAEPRADAPDAFTAALALRDAARAHIVAHAGEPDLDTRA
ncbi:MAG: AMP-binding protein, partial [Burkholderiaceae bacterium]|nr:AMP-binding protein [Burkholderiaceae bacterium]